ncbi:MAG: prepilin peptidase [Gammaproteobacteria bacterium]|nr:prepilin peptidase [Gammaproteobacteria bacterium]
MPMMDIFQTLPWLFILSAGLLGLIVGSFLNVVIHRLPQMMEREWRAHCAELSGAPQTVAPARFDLLHPPSHCPQCGRGVKAAENIPLLSYLLLGGKCAGCGARIALRYPIVEVSTALLSAVVAWYFGAGGVGLAALPLTWALIALSFIDFDHQLLPDSITLPFLWAGLGLSLFNVFVDSETAIIGALAGYLSLWSVYIMFKLVTGKQGMGHGDFKLLAMLGAWLGWQALPVIILLSSLLGALVGIALILLRGRDKNVPIPFGPYLALAGWISLLWGKDLTQAYLQFAGLA